MCCAFYNEFISYSPQSEEKEKCNKSFVLYRRILFTGKTLDPYSSSCSLPVLYILMLALLKKKKEKKRPPRTSRCPVSCSLIGCRSSLMYFSVRTHSHSRIVNRRQLQIFSMPNISQASATHLRFPQITSLIIHTARLSLAWTSTDLPPISGICLWFIKTCRWVKNLSKIVQYELGIS